MSFIVNAEYERVLFKDIVRPLTEGEILRGRISRQYLFYFINQDPSASLVSFWDVPEKTKEYFASLGINLPHHTQDLESARNWYGHLSDLELEKKLNNKLSVFDLLRSLGDLPKDAHVVTRSEEILPVIKKSHHKKWILKSPYSCGGNNITFITEEKDIPESLPFAHILEPYLDRVLDLSLYYDPISKNEFYYITHIHQNCTYLGGRVYQNQESLDLDLKNDGLFDVFSGVVQKLKTYLEILKKNNLSQPITLDSFIYREGHSLLGYPLCETNYRISMGTLNQNLRRFLPENGVGLLLALKANPEKDWKSVLPYSAEKKTGIISMNEGNPQSAIVLLCAPDLKTMHKYNQLVFDFNK